MATTKINLNGLSEIDFTNGIASASNVGDVTTITLATAGLISAIDCMNPTSYRGGIDCGSLA